MSYNVALLSSHDHCEYIKGIINTLNPDLPYTLHFEEFTRTADLPMFFTSIQDRYDAFCTTGAFPRMTILRTHPNCTKPVVAIVESVAEFYRILLNLLYKDRDRDFSKTYFDHSLWLPNGRRPTALDYLDGSAEYGEKSRKGFMERISLEQQLQAENIIVEHALALQNQGLLDLVVCRHSHAYLALKEKGIPCVFAYPSAGNVIDSLYRLADELNLIKMGDNLPGVICLSSLSLRSTGPEDVTVESIGLQKCLLDFDHENTAGMLIKKSASGFEMYTTRHTIQRLTEKFTQCALRKYRVDRLGQQADIGYGIGNDIMTARNRALEAMEFSQKNGQSYVLDEANTPIALKTSAAGLDHSLQEEKLEITAQKTNLSVVTLHRIRSTIDLLGRNEITTQELASTLQVTVANANRFMNRLEASGFAKVVGMKKATVQGRPSRIYRIEI